MPQDDTSSQAVTGRNDLVAWFEQGCKTGSDLRIGIEHEKIPFYIVDGLAPVPYEGDAATGRGGIKALLRRASHRSGRLAARLRRRSGQQPVASARMARASRSNPAASSSSPGAPLRTMHEIRDEIAGHLDEP